MSAVLTFPYIENDPRIGTASLAPMLPIKLTVSRSADVIALLDTGASVNVLPYSLGVQLGAGWDQQRTPLPLRGNLSAHESRALIVAATVAAFDPVQLIFAWVRTDNTSILLGQVNFFLEFDVCFHRARAMFEIQTKQAP